ncbi:MAG: alpha/beta fold hydrolase [Pseudomonadota bacterium]|nr:alpha/beta fold hydrolase [Pseudomonadota bacterium]
MIVLVAKLAAVSVATYFLVALGLIASQRVAWSPPEPGQGIAFAEMTGASLDNLPPTAHFTARDGARLSFRRYDAAGPVRRVLFLVHGSSWHGMQFHKMAQAIAGQGHATVIVPDMRGHGADPLRRGDIDHLGQLEEDVADLINDVKRQYPEAPVVLGGHSSGGGFVVRFAGGTYGDKADAFILMAPFLKHDAPTTRPNSGGWARPAVRRIIGLSMLNAVGIRVLNHLRVISFAMPRSVLEGPYGHTATTTYSFRLNQSFAPRRDYEKDIAAIRRPLLVLAGADDESFVAERYEEVISANTGTGTYHVLPGVNHLGIVTEDRSIGLVANWLENLPA